MYDLNKLMKNRKSKTINFSGASSRQLLQYMDVHLEGIQVVAGIIHVGVNNLLNYSKQSRIDSLMNNIISMVEKCRNYGVKSNFLFGIVSMTMITLDRCIT